MCASGAPLPCRLDRIHNDELHILVPDLREIPAPGRRATAHTYGHLHAPDKIPAPDDDITPDRLLCPHHLAGLTQEALEVLNEVFDEDE